ncbi:MAG: exo-beta-N-acetylmuramidase NamZ family protein, partial [Thermoanaerobaculia bacterium]
QFDWRRETYEFVSDRLAIDLLAGSARYREIVEAGGDIEEWVREWKEPLRDFGKNRQEFLLYKD